MEHMLTIIEVKVNKDWECIAIKTVCLGVAGQRRVAWCLFCILYFVGSR